jgi:hypothetical protein
MNWWEGIFPSWPGPPKEKIPRPWYRFATFTISSPHRPTFLLPPRKQRCGVGRGRHKTQPSLHNPRWWPVPAATPRGVHFHETCLPHRYRAGGERAVRQVCDGNEHGPSLPHCTKIQTVGFDRTSKSSHAGSFCVATPRFHHGDTSVSNLKARLCFLSLNTPRFVDGSPSRLLLLSIRCFVVMGTGI